MGSSPTPGPVAMAGFFNEGLCPPPVKRCKHRSAYKSTAKLSRSRERARCFYLARTLESQQESESQLKTIVNLENEIKVQKEYQEVKVKATLDLYKKDYNILKQEKNIFRKENNTMNDSISRFE